MQQSLLADKEDIRTPSRWSTCMLCWRTCISRLRAPRRKWLFRMLVGRGSSVSPSDVADLISLEYDKIPADTKMKEFHFTEAAANLNRADQALQMSGAGPEDEPVSVAMGKSESSVTSGIFAAADP